MERERTDLLLCVEGRGRDRVRGNTIGRSIRLSARKEKDHTPMRCWAHSCEGHNHNLSTESPIKNRRRALSREHLARGLRSSPPECTERRHSCLIFEFLSQRRVVLCVLWWGPRVWAGACKIFHHTKSAIPSSLSDTEVTAGYSATASFDLPCRRVGLFSMPSLPLLKRTAGLSPTTLLPHARAWHG